MNTMAEQTCFDLLSISSGEESMIDTLPLLDFHINLNNGKLSAKGTKKPMYGKLVCHADTALLYQPTMRVQQGSWARAVRERTRNVHAYARGYSLIDVPVEDYLNRPDIIRVRYNPFIHNFFFREDTEQPVTTADLVILDHHAMYAINPR